MTRERRERRKQQVADGKDRKPAERLTPLTVEEVLSYFMPDLSAGRLYWNCERAWYQRVNGKEAGCAITDLDNKTYWGVGLHNVKYRRAQIILLLATGIWPTDCVDHIDGNSLNDCATNLRHATSQQNAWNVRKRTKTGSTPMGVQARKGGRFVARIRRNYKLVTLGRFDTAEEAHAVYLNARKEYFGEFS